MSYHYYYYYYFKLITKGGRKSRLYCVDVAKPSNNWVHVKMKFDFLLCIILSVVIHLFISRFI